MDLGARGKNVIDVAAIPVSLTDISDRPENIKVIAGLEGTAIGRCHSRDRTGVIIGTRPTASKACQRTRKCREGGRRGEDKDHGRSERWRRCFSGAGWRDRGRER